MVLFNGLIRMDFAFGIALTFSLILQRDYWKSFFEGASAVFPLLCIFNHVAFYKETKKFY
jgi:hypothetical protein